VKRPKQSHTVTKMDYDTVSKGEGAVLGYPLKTRMDQNMDEDGFKLF